MAVRVVVLLGLALVIGVGTVIFAKRWIASVQQPPIVDDGPIAVVPDRFVLVAQGNLYPGMLLGPESFRWQGWPTEELPPSYIVQGQRTETDLFGAVVRREISAGEPITDFKIAKPGQQGFLAAVMTPGMRAITIPVNEARAGAGFILPGDRVDIILNHDIGLGLFSETVFTDIRVLAVDQVMSNPENLPAKVSKYATVEVTPREVEAVTLMQEMGTIYLSLRSLQPGDGEDLADNQQIAANDTPDSPAGMAMAEKPETVDKVPAVYPSELPADSDADVPNQSVANAVGQSLGELSEVDPNDQHAIRREGQTITGPRDVSVLFGGTTTIVVTGN